MGHICSISKLKKAQSVFPELPMTKHESQIKSPENPHKQQKSCCSDDEEEEEKEKNFGNFDESPILAINARKNRTKKKMIYLII